MDTTRKRPQSLDGVVRICDRPLEDVCPRVADCVGGIAGDREVTHDPKHSLLRPVMEVSFKSPSLGLARFHDSPA